MDETKQKINTFFFQFPTKTFTQGELILQPDEDPSMIYYINNGHVREYSISPEGIEFTIHLFVPESYFPMTWALADIHNRYYFEALTPTITHLAPKQKVLEFLHQEPEVLQELTIRLLKGLDKLVLRMEGLVYNQADKKLISTILFLAQHFGTKNHQQVRLERKFTHKDIAAFAGISRETASREWEKLQHHGYINYEDHYIIIHDIDRLKKLLSNELAL